MSVFVLLELDILKGLPERQRKDMQYGQLLLGAEILKKQVMFNLCASYNLCFKI